MEFSVEGLGFLWAVPIILLAVEIADSYLREPNGVGVSPNFSTGSSTGTL